MLNSKTTVILGFLSLLGLAACGSKQVAMPAEAPAAASEYQPAASTLAVESSAGVVAPNEAGGITADKNKAEGVTADKNKATGVTPEKNEAGGVTAYNNDEEVAKKREEYINALHKGNAVAAGPSDLDFGVSAKFMLRYSPKKNIEQLAQEVRETFRKNGYQNVEVQSGGVTAGFTMKAELTGSPDQVDIVADSGNGPSGVQDVLNARDRTWIWYVRPKVLSGDIPLQFHLYVVMPKELGKPELLDTLDKKLIAHPTIVGVFQKYWVIVSAVGGSLGWYFREFFRALLKRLFGTGER
ncbi:hypothetical protein [Paludibacterium purpuratum]|uniref:Lipoprotein n=1 Tax=Paludibacterium purpuratum TaxID=1144873 RepID=A0A4R7BCX9_9NEIS|nr:hypothetical protein [Paludibacterium purpuratum]TDR82914.1 hypothetical protein DFP86_101308 [Paludibacterium purpuratum]